MGEQVDVWTGGWMDGWMVCRNKHRASYGTDMTATVPPSMTDTQGTEKEKATLVQSHAGASMRTVKTAPQHLSPAWAQATFSLAAAPFRGRQPL